MRVRIAFIEHADAQAQMLFKAVLEAETALTQRPMPAIDSIKREEVRTTAQMTQLVNAGYDYVVMSLRLPQYGSLRLAELAHRLRSPTHFVLYTASNGRPRILAMLFDHVVPQHSLRELVELVQTPPPPPTRIDSDDRLDGAIAAVLATAGCFSKGSVGAHLGPPSKLDEYRRDLPQHEPRVYPPGQEMVVNGSVVIRRPAKVFVSYSHEDENLRAALQTHLALLERQQVLEAWSDRKITAGGNWKLEIDKNLAEADIIVLLVSADFIASDYCFGIEMATALERSEHNVSEAIVIPVIVRACDWHSAPFAKLQALPKDGRAVTSCENVDEAWAEVARGIRAAVTAWTSPIDA
jgi:hypothetical protein